MKTYSLLKVELKLAATLECGSLGQREEEGAQYLPAGKWLLTSLTSGSSQELKQSPSDPSGTTINYPKPWWSVLEEVSILH